MILEICIETNGTSAKTTVALDDPDEAREAGREFYTLVESFVEGYLEAGGVE